LPTDLSKGSKTILDQTCRYLLEYFKSDPRIDLITPLDGSKWKAALQRGELWRAKAYPKPREIVAESTKYRGYRKSIDAGKLMPLSDSTVSKHVRCAKTMFAKAGPDGDEILLRDPFRKLSARVPESDTTWETVTAEDLKRIMDECPNRAWKMLFALCRFAGLRRGEALSLKWCDVLWDKNRLVINARTKKSTKKGMRVCPIEPQQLRTGLTALLQEAFQETKEGQEYVCPDINVGTLHDNAMRILARAGKVYSDPFHTLRRNREMELASKYPIKPFSKWQGHHPEVALKFYLKVDDELYDLPEEVPVPK
jgi:integrase